MEKRLRPINGLLGLCQPGELNPSPLADAGFRLVALEVPVGVDQNRVVIDVVLLHEATSLLLACECKSGANVDETQARKYASLDANALAQAASVDLRPTRPTAATLYVCLAENVARIHQGLTASGVTVPVLAVGSDRVNLVDPASGPTQLADAFADGRTPLLYSIARVIPCDDSSPRDIVMPQVKAVLVSHLSHRSDQVGTSVIANETLAHLPIYGKAARKRFQKIVDDSVRAIAKGQPDTFQFEGATAHREALVRFLRTPEDHDNRGRTQAYQALARPGHTGRKPRPQDPDQLDLLDELGTDTEDSDGPDDSEGGVS